MAHVRFDLLGISFGILLQSQPSAFWTHKLPLSTQTYFHLLLTDTVADLRLMLPPTSYR